MSVDFDPVRLGPRRRRIDPIAVGVLGTVLALGLAVAKPWDQGIPPVRPVPTVAAVAAQTLAATPSGAPRPTTRPVRPAAAQPPSWSDVAAVVSNHDAWGVHALVVDRRADRALTGPPSYLDLWSAASTAGGRTDAAAVDPGAGSVVILGISTPRRGKPRDVRIWRVHRNDQLEWMAATPIGSGPSTGSLLFVRPGLDGAASTPWEAGH